MDPVLLRRQPPDPWPWRTYQMRGRRNGPRPTVRAFVCATRKTFYFPDGRLNVAPGQMVLAYPNGRHAVASVAAFNRLYVLVEESD